MSAPKPRLRALGERLAREQDAILARHPGPSTFVGDAHAARPARRRPIAWLAAAALAAMVAVTAVILVARARPLALSVAGRADREGRWISAPHDTAVPIRFSDGTEMTLAPEGHARVLDVTRLGAHLMLESGTAQVSVTPNRGGRWTVTAGPFTVEVKGTRFAIAWSPREQLFTLRLVEGSVVISGCAIGDGRPLYAGETLRASCLANEFHIDRGAQADAPSPPSSAVLAPNDEAPTDPRAPSPPSPVAPAPPPAPASAPRATTAAESWQSLARASKFKEAFARVNERGFDAEMARAAPDDLVLLGDVARLGGDPDRALLAYQKVRARAPGTDAAANAAFSIGRVDFDQRRAYADAARWFAIYRSERAEGPLARDATGRQMEALARAGDRATAARIADEYLRRYPSGPHAPLARTLRADVDSGAP